MARQGLTPKQTRFVAEYLVDLNATQAAIRAGYSAKTARQIGQRLLTKVDIAAAVGELQAIVPAIRMNGAVAQQNRTRDSSQAIRAPFDAVCLSKPFPDIDAAVPADPCLTPQRGVSVHANPDALQL